MMNRVLEELSEEEIDSLVLSFLSKTDDEGEQRGFTAEEIQEFLEACGHALLEAKLIEMSAAGLIAIYWEKEKGFSYSASKEERGSDEDS